jgi:signal transduction histidine kinase
LLALHLPALVAVGLVDGDGAGRIAAAVVGPLACLWVGTRLRGRAAPVVVTTGLVLCSGALVELADGAPEAHVHPLVLLAFVAVYQDWLPFVWAAVFGVALTAFVAEAPWPWTTAYAGAVVVACTGHVLVWLATDAEQRRSAALAAELARTQSQVEARESVSELFVNLARRNQALLDRQIDLIVSMQEREADPDQLAELFQLDHLATRIRRNAESLLVLSGEEPARRWGRPVAIADVARAAIAEVEEYRRTDIAVDESSALAGRAVADVAHLLAELVENGLQFSPPDCRVRLASAPRPDGGCVLTVEDRGIGLPPADLAAANELLARPPEVDLRLSKRLGFHVVGRLAARYQLRVSLGPTPGGGVTATVVVPPALLSPPEPAVTAPPPPPAPPPPVVRAPGQLRFTTPSLPTVAGRVLTSPAAARPPARPPAPVAAGTDALPRRVPQASINPAILTGEPLAPVAVAGAATTEPRSPEELRATLSRFQEAQARGRKEAGEG